MDSKQKFEELMSEAHVIALASSVDDVPNVRYLNFLFSAKEKILYFESGKEASKTKEFGKNNNVAFITLLNDFAHIRVHRATVKKSAKTIYDLQVKWLEKMPYYKEIIDEHGKDMDIYEVQFQTAMLYHDPHTIEKIELE